MKFEIIILIQIRIFILNTFYRFGANKKPLPLEVSLWDSIKQEAMKLIWVVIAATALFSGLCGLFVNGPKAIAEAVSIIAIGFGILSIAALFDWYKDKRFVELQSLTKDEDITVIRGKW